jgi:hypothetical protein
MRPFYAEGSKSLGFETAEQLGWRLPDHCVVPVASGALLTRIDRAFAELTEIGGRGGQAVRISGAQPAGCSPVAQGFASGGDEVRPVRPDTIARSLAIGNPRTATTRRGRRGRTDGVIDACEENEIVEGISLLAETEGVFAETAGGVTIACLKRTPRARRDPRRRGGRRLHHRLGFQDGGGAGGPRASSDLREAIAGGLPFQAPQLGLRVSALCNRDALFDEPAAIGNLLPVDAQRTTGVGNGSRTAEGVEPVTRSLLRRLVPTSITLVTMTAVLSPSAGAAPGGSAPAQVRVNQVGYAIGASKRAYLMTSAAAAGATFSVKSGSATVFSHVVGADSARGAPATPTSTRSTSPE